uniref:HD/PDEase domain-containing protein n=1 Tax=Acrobeloides nanus TaxID=290746 RepID=A0A914E3W7_9BILA
MVEFNGSSVKQNGNDVLKKLEWDQTRGVSNYFEIVDVVHDSIGIFHPIEKIINTPEFQRLRNIKQMGIAYLVYPSAEHSRFTHSLGVYHLARSHINALSERQPNLGITSTDKLCVCIAGLLHDLGHGPYSHMFEVFLHKANPSHSWRHEEGSKLIFKRMLDQNHEVKEALDRYLSEEDYLFIEELIDPPKSFIDNHGNWKLKGRPISKSFIYDIVSNKHDCLDVDKFDYLMRDSKLSKITIPFGKVTLGRIQNNMEARKFEDVGYSRIVYGRKVRSDVYTVMYSREDLHSRLYQHKTSVAIETMVVDALVKAAPYLEYKGDDGRYYDLYHAFENISAYLQLNDYVTEKILESNDPRLAEAKSILDQINRRELLRCVGTTFFTTIPYSVEQIKEDILKFDDTIDPNMVIVAVRQIHRGFTEVDPITKTLYFNQNDPSDNVLERPSDQWIRSNTSEAGRTNVYVYVPFGTSMDDYNKVFHAFEKTAKSYNCESPAKRQRRS